MLLFSHFLCGKTRYKQNDENNPIFFFFLIYICAIMWMKPLNEGITMQRMSVCSNLWICCDGEQATKSESLYDNSLM